MNRRFSLIVLTSGVITASVIVAIQTTATVAQSDSVVRKRKPFDGWTKPVAALFVTGRQNGYLEPCGCTGLENQKGGLARRHSLLKMFINRNWDIAPVDVGNQIRRTGVQPELKLQATLQALRTLKYQAVGLGPDDLRLSTNELIQALVAKTDDNGKSDLFVSANVNAFDFISPYRVIQVGPKKIGITTVIGTDHIENNKNDEIELQSPDRGLANVIPKLQEEKCDFLVLMAYASLEESRMLARKFPEFHLVVSGGSAGEPTMLPERISGTKTRLIQSGNKGMYVGIIGFFDDQENPIKYERIELDKRFKDSQDMLDVLKDYQKNLRLVFEEKGYAGLGISPVIHPSGKNFVGSETCGECHTTAFEIWENTPHHHATDSIVHPPERSEVPRHYDPECLSCHVTGWNPQQYFPFKSGYAELEKSKHLHGNGCENCHGPGSAHVAAENGEGDLSEEQINSLRKSMVLPLAKAEHMCMECHDLDNSPDFHKKGAFMEYWQQIEHVGKD